MIKSIQGVSFKNKRVLLRVDFNVSNHKDPEHNIRLFGVLPTINYLRSQGAKIILLSHRGRPDGRAKKLFSLKPILPTLNHFLKIKIKFCNDLNYARELSYKIKPKEILLLENLRFWPGEEKNDKNFAKKLAGLGDVYVNDAFSVSHRKHASQVAITKFLPSYGGFLLLKEVNVLENIVRHPKRPLSVVIGGAKAETKVILIKKFLKIADNVMLGGALANTVLAAKHISIGKSIIDRSVLDKIHNLDLTNPKFHLPVDGVVARNLKSKEKPKIKAIGYLEPNELILDIGPASVKLYSNILKKSKMTFWNGPVGLFEDKRFRAGTKGVAEAIIKSKAYSVVGGGDVISALMQLKLLDKIKHVSSGGGALLEFLAGKKLPGLAAMGFYK